MTQLLTIRDVAERLRISTRTVHRLIGAKQLQTIRLNRSIRIAQSELDRFLERGKEGSIEDK